MSKKSHVNTPKPRPAHNAAPFPAACNVLTPQQRDLPNPTAALAELSQPQPSERARLRAASVQHEQREARARKEAQQILAAAERPAPTVHDDLQAAKRRPWDAPMATKANQLPQLSPQIIGAGGWLPDPLAVLAWETIAEDAAATARQWRGQWKFTVALAVWSAACFVLGTLA